MPTGYDTGSIGTVVSLAGISGRRGVIVKRPDASVAADAEVLHANPLRVWALIQNIGANDITLSFDADTSVAPTFILTPKSVLQIDKNLPWTGSVYVDIPAGGGSVTWIEAEIRE